MSFVQLPIQTWGAYSPPKVSVRIKRQSDGLYYDSDDKTFKGESVVKTPFIPLTKSLSPLVPTLVEVYVGLNPAQFSDGDYIIYFHDVSTPANSLYAIDEVYIQGGSCMKPHVPNTTENAGRLMDATVASHKLPGSVGAWMLDVTARLEAIRVKLGA